MSVLKIIGFLLIALAILDLVLFYAFGIDMTGFKRTPAIFGGVGYLLVVLSKRKNESEAY